MEASKIPQNESLQCYSSLSELCNQSFEAFQSARKKIQIYTRNLDPRILNQRKVEQQLLQFIRSSRYARLEILITDEKNLQGIDHRIVSLTQKYTSFASIRVIPKDFHENHFAFYLIDGRQLIYRSVSDRFECEIHRPPSGKIKQKLKFFDEVWQQSASATHLRALMI